MIKYILAFCALASSALAVGPITGSGSIPSKIVGPNNATVDVSSGNVGITAQSGGAINVSSGDLYTAGIVDFTTTVSPMVTAAGHYAMAFDGTNILASVNGGAYVATKDVAQTLTNKTISGASNTLSNILPSAITAKSANFTVDWSTVQSGTLFNTTTSTSTITATFTNPTAGKIIGLAKADSAAGKIITSPTISPAALGVANQGQIIWIYSDGTNYFVLTQAGVTTMDVNGAVAVTPGGTNQGITLTPSGSTGAVNIGQGTILQVGQGVGVRVSASYNMSDVSNAVWNIRGGTGFVSAANTSYNFTSANNSPFGTIDTAVSRNAARVVEVNNGTAGTFGDLIVRNMTIGGSSGTQITKAISATATLDFTSTSAQTSSELTITLTGAVDGDDVILSPPNASSNANTCFTARVSAADTVTVKFNNYSSGAVDPASGTFRVSIIRF